MLRYIVLWWRFFPIYIFVAMSCHAQDILDVETLPYLRSKQYSLEPYKKIIVFSAPRTGSSLVYNTMNFLFEDFKNLSYLHNELHPSCYVLKTHRFDDLNSLISDDFLYVITLRNPVDAIVSNYRICPRKISNIRDFAKRLMIKHRDYLIYCEKMKNAGKHVIFLKYEDFENNMDYLNEFIEHHFRISIADSDKVLMKNGYAKENVYSLIKDFSDFKQFLPFSGFHGKHLSIEKYNPPDELLYWLNIYFDDVKPIFEKYGY